MKTATYIKLDFDVKQQAQSLAQNLGLSLSTLVNVQLKQLIRHRKLELQADFPAEQMTPELEAELAKIQLDDDPKNWDGPFSTDKELKQFFKSIKKNKLPRKVNVES